jgi:hypothetical protein
MARLPGRGVRGSGSGGEAFKSPAVSPAMVSLIVAARLITLYSVSARTACFPSCYAFHGGLESGAVERYLLIAVKMANLSIKTNIWPARVSDGTYAGRLKVAPRLNAKG